MDEPHYWHKRLYIKGSNSIKRSSSTWDWMCSMRLFMTWKHGRAAKSSRRADSRYLWRTAPSKMAPWQHAWKTIAPNIPNYWQPTLYLLSLVSERYVTQEPHSQGRIVKVWHVRANRRRPVCDREVEGIGNTEKILAGVLTEVTGRFLLF